MPESSTNFESAFRAQVQSGNKQLASPTKRPSKKALLLVVGLPILIANIFIIWMLVNKTTVPSTTNQETVEITGTWQCDTDDIFTFTDDGTYTSINEADFIIEESGIFRLEGRLLTTRATAVQVNGDPQDFTEFPVEDIIYELRPEENDQLIFFNIETEGFFSCGR